MTYSQPLNRSVRLEERKTTGKANIIRHPFTSNYLFGAGFCLQVHSVDLSTCAPLALQILHHILGGGGRCLNIPRLSRILLVVEKNGKKSLKAREKGLRNYFSQIFAQVKIVVSRGQKYPKFRVFRDCRTSFRKISIISVHIIATANPKTSNRKRIKLPIAILSSDLI